MANEQPPVEWGEGQSEGTAPDDVNYVGPPGYTNSTLLDDLWLAIKRLYNCSVTHRCLSADLLDGKHGTYYGLYVAGAEVGTPNLVAGAGVDLSVSGSNITITVSTASLDHGALSGLADDDHALYAKGDPDSSSTTGNLASFLNTDGRSLEDSGIAANNVTLNSDNLSNLENAGDARANLGLGDRATQNDGDDLDAADVVYDGEMHVAGVSTPTISANTNDLNADGVGFLRANVSALGSVDLTGIVAPSPAANRLLYIQNVGGNPLVLKNQDANSSAANRFLLPGGVDLTLAGNGVGATLLYDTASSRWRCVGHTN